MKNLKIILIAIFIIATTMAAKATITGISIDKIDNNPTSGDDITSFRTPRNFTIFASSGNWNATASDFNTLIPLVISHSSYTITFFSRRVSHQGLVGFYL